MYVLQLAFCRPRRTRGLRRRPFLAADGISTAAGTVSTAAGDLLPAAPRSVRLQRPDSLAREARCHLRTAPHPRRRSGAARRRPIFPTGSIVPSTDEILTPAFAPFPPREPASRPQWSYSPMQEASRAWPAVHLVCGRPGAVSGNHLDSSRWLGPTDRRVSPGEDGLARPAGRSVRCDRVVCAA